ncbi:cysteine--tRNA ligase [Effusibacillus dendaii]|uniref:Cysteine--tRNA ligase n=1 Tax=Effusibacillus dendaii TaxID=2743772 RepID=A0A7I8DFL7_9BACL|nr:cysteine--tRNA ligase [Effusibacillus dendaii]BCJ87360.1 cysteine--tRNA ligase [Effusibacillus dendaii]
MAIRIYNTLTRQKEEFVPQEPGKVRMYVCGPTVYNYFHIGNARPFMFFDVVRRYLKFRGFDVLYVQNFTDVDDKIIRVAKEEGIHPQAVADRFIQAYMQDSQLLGIQKADVHPCVTEHMQEIIEMIEQLIKQGCAYAVDGDVYFRTNRFPDYGKLSKQPLEELLAGARIEVSEKKENPLDFTLWKAAKPGEVYWPSPWGEGRPGWHIECSAMSKKYLGETLDIHAGGQDLIFPHHENEIAQSEAANQEPFARYWMHNGYININNEKMSKSQGNFILVHDLLKKFEPRIVRFFLLSAHYRNPVNFSDELIQQAAQGLERIDTAMANLSHWLTTAEKGESDSKGIDREALRAKFLEAMDDDFNTADAIAAIFELVRQANSLLHSGQANPADVRAYFEVISEFLDVLGLAKKESTDPLAVEIEQLIEERTTARKNRDFARADQIRDRLTELGIILEDTPQGVRWKRK